MRPVYIEWCDSVNNDPGWCSLEEAKKWYSNDDWIIKQLGFVVEETENYICLSFAINPQENETMLNGLFKIPTSWIKKKLYLDDAISS